jgi:hypothetical protein
VILITNDVDEGVLLSDRIIARPGTGERPWPFLRGGHPAAAEPEGR